ncbi:MAG TPA: VCBS repeat-containing protein [Nannocystaceae bacterium]|nr:VCBS repeat-containing protein [Nannocystaceae bacterium]
MGRGADRMGSLGVATLVLAACGPSVGSECDASAATVEPEAGCPIPTPLAEIRVSFAGVSADPIAGMIAIDVDPTPGVELLVVRGNQVQMVIAGQAVAIVTAPATLLGAVAGDIDGDGDFDLLTSEDDGGAVLRIWWREGAAFVDSTITQPLGEGTAFALTDHDADHDLDALVREGSSVVMYPFEGIAFGPARVAIAGPIDAWTIFDAEPDGLADLLYAAGGTITLEPRVEIAAPTSLVVPGLAAVRSLAIGDFTADGILDAFVIGDGDETTWSTLVGPLLTESPFTRSPTSSCFQRPGAGDLDADGHADLVLSSGGDHLLVRYGRMAGDGEPFHCEYELPIPLAADRAALFDADGDGRNELLVSDGDEVVLLDF